MCGHAYLYAWRVLNFLAGESRTRWPVVSANAERRAYAEHCIIHKVHYKRSRRAGGPIPACRLGLGMHQQPSTRREAWQQWGKRLKCTCDRLSCQMSARPEPAAESEKGLIRTRYAPAHFTGTHGDSFSFVILYSLSERALVGHRLHSKTPVTITPQGRPGRNEGGLSFLKIGWLTCNRVTAIGAGAAAREPKTRIRLA